MSDYITELGIGSSDTTQTDVEVNDTVDFVQDSTTEESNDDTKKDTEPNISETLRKQIEGLEKRISDKDEYINLLRDQSKSKEMQNSTEEVDTETDIDFWDDPEKIVKSMQETIRIQQMQIQETVYANTVDNYWKTVNPEALKTAVATDTEFSKEFNKSSEPYRLAYEYLSNKTQAEQAKTKTLEEEIRAKILKEMGMDKPKKEAVPNMGSMGGANTKKTDLSDDGFASVFGKR